MPVEEALALERKVSLQDARVMGLFREVAKDAVAKDADEEDPESGRRLTPSMVLVCWGNVYGGPPPLLTSVRRALTNLTNLGLLVHYKHDRRESPRGARESTWGLA